jgi:hypothetical protein
MGAMLLLHTMQLSDKVAELLFIKLALVLIDSLLEHSSLALFIQMHNFLQQIPLF